jgi:hypothetical protein
MFPCPTFLVYHLLMAEKEIKIILVHDLYQHPTVLNLLLELQFGADS